MDENQLHPSNIKLSSETPESLVPLDVNSLSIQELTDKFILSAEHERLHGLPAFKTQTLTSQDIQKMYNDSATVKQTHDEHMKIMKMARKNNGTKFSYGVHSKNLKMDSECINGKSLHKKDSTGSKVDGEGFQSTFNLFHEFENPYNFVNDEGFNTSLHRPIFESRKSRSSLLETKPLEDCRDLFSLVIKQLRSGTNFNSIDEVHQTYCRLLDEIESPTTSDELIKNDLYFFSHRKSDNRRTSDSLPFYLARSVIDYSLPYFSSNCKK